MARVLQKLEERARRSALYVFLGELAHRGVPLLAGGDRARFSAIFAVVERWLVEGDPYVKEAAVIGFLEGVQNHASNG